MRPLRRCERIPPVGLFDNRATRAADLLARCMALLPHFIDAFLMHHLATH